MQRRRTRHTVKTSIVTRGKNATMCNETRWTLSLVTTRHLSTLLTGRSKKQRQRSVRADGMIRCLGVDTVTLRRLPCCVQNTVVKMAVYVTASLLRVNQRKLRRQQTDASLSLISFYVVTAL